MKKPANDPVMKGKMPSKPVAPAYKEPPRPTKPNNTSEKKLIG